MPCLTAQERQEIQIKIDKKQTIVDNLYTAMENFDGVEQYKFSSGEAMQQTKYRSLKDIQDQITTLEAQIERLKRKLHGTGLMNVNLRRKGYTWPY